MSYKSALLYQDKIYYTISIGSLDIENLIKKFLGKKEWNCFIACIFNHRFIKNRHVPRRYCESVSNLKSVVSIIPLIIRDYRNLMKYSNIDTDTTSKIRSKIVNCNRFRNGKNAKFRRKDKERTLMLNKSRLLKDDIKERILNEDYYIDVPPDDRYWDVYSYYDYDYEGSGCLIM